MGVASQGKMDRFTCYYCAFGANDFANIINHTSVCHKNDYLKIRSLELDLECGKLGYRTHNFNVLPSSNSKIEVKNDNPGNLCVRVVFNEEYNAQTSVFRSPLAKKVKRMNDSEKQRSDDMPTDCEFKNPSFNFNPSSTDLMEIDDNFDKFETEQEDETALIKLVMDVLKTLKKYEFADIWQKFNELLCRDEWIILLFCCSPMWLSGTVMIIQFRCGTMKK
ncbi:hypothetical protein KUTeg_020219 [Tegillarca granosa]|uniref:C2H2-type domain-containing protein n=1 Tax=Tegillarca granosa TaxID=220873 RepID=A0ABQ9EBG5_TEGGR|nr:hypothetical protein KUTeg_020219 [Tegillarca granosa]